MNHFLKNSVIFCLLITTHQSFSQTKWKRFHSKVGDYTLMLPTNFELGPRLSNGIIQWFMDTNRMDIQICVETSSFTDPIEIIFEDHKKKFTLKKYEELSKNWFVISGSEGLGIGQLNDNEAGQTYFMEKCIIKKNRMCILRILYSDYSKTFIDDHIGKINESFK